MKAVVLLGATGSIGSQTLDVIDTHPDAFRLIGATTHQSASKLVEICKQHALQVVASHATHRALFENINDLTWYDVNALDQLVEAVPQDTLIVNALLGSAGLKPTLAALNRGMTVLLANKETLVVGGPLIQAVLEVGGGQIVPIDSEHAALAHCLRGRRIEDIDKVIITASGGSFRDLSKAQLKDVTVEDALKHPNWSMGAKITIDSATMMNKVFEIIEAHLLFDLPYDKIEAVLHRESIVHAMIHYQDGNILAHLGPADMRIPILSALQGEACLPYRTLFDITKIGTLHFAPIPEGRYPLYDLGLMVAQAGGHHIATMNAANEVAVALFLSGHIRFTEIEKVIVTALDIFPNEPITTLEALLAHDQAVRDTLYERFQKGDTL